IPALSWVCIYLFLDSGPLDSVSSVLFFFFQAEDGIRDSSVMEFRRVLFRSRDCRSRNPIVNAVAAPAVSAVSASMTLPLIAGTRSEERRVGKECRSRGAASGQEKRRTEGEERGGWTKLRE